MSAPNWHRVVRGAITQVNDDTDGQIKVSLPPTVVRGISTPQYSVVNVTIQVQGVPHDQIWHQDGLSYATDVSNVFAFGNFNNISRPTGGGGDLVLWGGNTYYIRRVLEWWANEDGWCRLEVIRQLDNMMPTT
ncbi:hypothetical protein T2_00018 [Ralstonia phage Elie]|uniref:Head closure protein 1 n=4 Tax=Bakolyvirus TaxID=2843355 RepID=A0A7G5BBP7_9CAUD|nr:head protein [Ralstonia phage Adzire]YP_010052789.1 head protein [Ralstonia phage Bakoly]YP_010077705.1 head protein [Ralstonia phage Simangalove]QMV32963.1 hypothetical protein T2_00018 [Ralstonia phage Elie]QMV33530.1 head closure protein 1 [Ralstonia phage Jenny]QMV33675.1 head closure protein 1 [Ralstonia phage Sarlave]QMV32335.1 head closure protein 1 [Ralstonia phage Adzire]QMV32613.1 head closure protein 1 [Ralstonia phage Bakoly]